VYEINSKVFLFVADIYFWGVILDLDKYWQMWFLQSHHRLESSWYLGKYSNNPAILPGICSTQSRNKGCPQSILPLICTPVYPGTSFNPQKCFMFI